MDDYSDLVGITYTDDRGTAYTIKAVDAEFPSYVWAEDQSGAPYWQAGWIVRNIINEPAPWA